MYYAILTLHFNANVLQCLLICIVCYIGGTVIALKVTMFASKWFNTCGAEKSVQCKNRIVV